MKNVGHICRCFLYFRYVHIKCNLIVATLQVLRIL